jgi:branched-chain amino acid transport system substrate-binding protein
MSRLTRRLGWLSILFVLLAAACNPPTGGQAPAQTGGQAQQTTAPIRIGASISLTGTYARSGQELQVGYQIWQEMVNAKGGLLGRQVEFVIIDDQSDPETAARLYEKLISEDKVDLVIGPYSSPVTLPASTVAEKYGYPMIVSGASATEIWTRGYKNVFGIYTAAPFYMDGAIDIAQKNGLRTVAVANENSAFAKDLVRGAKERAQKANLQVVFEEEYGRDVRDLSPLLTKMRAANPDVLIGGTYGEDATLLVRQLKDLGWAPKIVALAIGPALPDFAENLGTDAEYVMGPTQWEPSIKATGVPEFVNAYKAKLNRDPGYHAAGGYAAAQLLQQAVEKAGSLDNNKIRDTLMTIEAKTIYGDYKVDATGAQLAKASYLVQLQGGQRKIVWPDAVAEAKYTVPLPEWNRR